jgi:hypothetical protein
MRTSGFNFEQTLDAAVPIGTTCRLCERLNCDQHGFPPLQHGIVIDENIRGSFYAPREAAPEPVRPVKKSRKRA